MPPPEGDLPITGNPTEAGYRLKREAGALEPLFIGRLHKPYVVPIPCEHSCRIAYSCPRGPIGSTPMRQAPEIISPFSMYRFNMEGVLR